MPVDHDRRLTPLDDRACRRARTRAAAARIADAPRVARRFLPAPAAELRSSGRRRSSRPPTRARVVTGREDRDPRRASRRRVVIAALVVQLLALGAVLTLPMFRVDSVRISGTSLISADSVLAASGLREHPSLFTVDGAAVQQRLLRLGWVRSATVETELPNRVAITVAEWSPMVRLRAGGHELLVAANGASIDLSRARPGARTGVPLIVDARPHALAAEDVATAGGALMRTLSLTASRFPSVFGCGVASFQWTADGSFAISATTGWSAILGHLDTAAAVNQVPEQLTALASLKGQLDFVHPKFGYVDLEAPGQPAVGGSPGAPLPVAAATAVVPAPPGGPAAHPSSPAPPVPAPVPPVPVATPASPQVRQFTLPTPSPTR